MVYTGLHAPLLARLHARLHTWSSIASKSVKSFFASACTVDRSRQNLQCRKSTDVSPRNLFLLCWFRNVGSKIGGLTFLHFCLHGGVSKYHYTEAPSHMTSSRQSGQESKVVCGNETSWQSDFETDFRAKSAKAWNNFRTTVEQKVQTVVV